MGETVDPTVAAPRAAVPLAGQAPGSFSDRVPALAWLIAAAFVAVELAVSGRYCGGTGRRLGYHRGSADHLPPVLSGHNAYWMWGPGRASDQTVLVVDALGWLRPYSPAAVCSPPTTPHTRSRTTGPPSRSASAPGLRPAGTRYGPG